MKRFTGFMVMLFSITLFCAGIALAQDATFTAQSEGSITLSKGALDAVRGAVRDEIAKGVNVSVRPSGLNGVRDGVADLQDRMGFMEDAQRDLVSAFNRHDERTANPARRDEPVHHFWWVMLGVLIGYILGMLMFHGRSGETSHGGSVTGPLIEGPLVECPGHAAPTAETRDGVVPIAQIPAIPGTSYRIEAPEPTERTIHRIEEVRMDANTADAVVTVAEGIIEAIGRMPKPDKPATPQA